jgi:hypothetical protein
MLLSGRRIVGKLETTPLILLAMEIPVRTEQEHA